MRKNVLILYNKLWHYRLPVFSILGNKYNLTVAYSIGDDNNVLYNFKTIKLPVVKIGRFIIHKDNLHNLCKDYDIVVAYGDISWLSLMGLGFFKSTFGLIYWSVGVRASYKTKYNEKTFWDIVRFYLFSKSDSLVFYSDVPIKRYIEKGWDEADLFTANNTVEVLNTDMVSCEKDRILFVGTLYKEKGTHELLESFLKAKIKNPSVPDLHIIGGGDGLEDVKNFVKNKFLSESVFVHGPIYDETALSNHFVHSYACISPNQAGLSVLKSLGYGVPYVTKNNAITGGEIMNITNGVTGRLYEQPEELINIIIEIANNPGKFLQMGKSAKKHYDSCRKPSDMANGLIEAIEHVIAKRSQND